LTWQSSFTSSQSFAGIAQACRKHTMQLIFMADFSHDDEKHSLLLIDAYIKGTKPWVGNGNDPVKIEPCHLIRDRYINGILVTPVVGEPGKNWTGRIIFIDQFHRKYNTDRQEFVFTGPKEHPAKALLQKSEPLSTDLKTANSGSSVKQSVQQTASQ
jgi:hypothetical protein